MVNGPVLSTSKPIVSVLLPVRNAAAFLPHALNSLFRQSLSAFEIIAVDDGSEDQSLDVLRHFSRRDSRLKVIENPPRGIVSALETARRAAQAPTLARSDADDVSHPQRLEQQWEHLRELPDSTALGCLVCGFPRFAVGEGCARYLDWMNRSVRPQEIRREIYVENPLAHPTMMMSAEVLEQVGGWTQGDWPEDYDLVLRLHHASVTLEKVPKHLYAIREHPKRLTWTDSRYRRDAFIRCKARYLARELSGTEFAIWGAGRAGKWLARALLDHDCLPSHFIDIDRRKIGGASRGVPVHSPSFLKESGARSEKILVAVSSRGAGEIVRQRLSQEFGRREGTDFIVCA